MSGAMGDLGTFLPLTIGLSQKIGLDFGTTLLFTGAYNVLTGIQFGIPMPVQPMKSIAAIALSEKPLTVPQVCLAGFTVSIVIFLVGLTGVIDLFQRLFPLEVIRGIQLGLGYKLAVSGILMMVFVDGKEAKGFLPFASGPDNTLLALLFAVFFVMVSPQKKPSGSPLTPSSNAITPSLRTARGVEVRGDGDGLLVVPQGSHHVASSGEGKEKGRGAEGDGRTHTQRESPTCAPPARLLGSGALSSSRSDDAVNRPFALRREETDIESAGEDPDLELKKESASSGTGLDDRVYLTRASSDACGSPRAGDNTASYQKGECVSDVSDGPSVQPSRSSISRCRRFLGWILSVISGLPAALVAVLVGILLVLCFHASVLSSLRLGPSVPHMILPTDFTWESAGAAVVRGAIPQLPLTALNSVVSVCDLSEELFPDRAAKPRGVATSVGMMNIVGCWFGALPSCHGAGGLAAQSRFGASTGGAPIFLGIVKIALGLLFGSSLVFFLSVFPGSLLGVMLVFAGVELASTVRSCKSKGGMFVALATAVSGEALNNTAIGFACGMVLSLLLGWRVGGFAALRLWVTGQRKLDFGD